MDHSTCLRRGSKPRPFMKGHFIQSFPKRGLIDRERRVLSNTRMREVVMAIRRSFDPDAPWPER